MATLARVLAGTAALALAGCQAYSPYGYGYGGTYTVPHGPYVPQGAMVAPGPQAQLQPTPYAETPTHSHDAKSAHSRPLPPSLLPNERPVPHPRDAEPPRPAGLAEGADEIGKPAVDRTGTKKEAPGLQNFIDDSGDHGAQLEGEDVPEPARLQLTGDERPLGLGASLTEDDPSPFDYDRDRYTWLRGLLEFDDEDGVWRIRYASSDFDDQYSGRLTLAPDERIDSLLNKDVVLLRGHIDMQQRDSHQKPMYVIEDAKRLRPSQR